MTEPSIGHNSVAEQPTSFAKDQLKAVIERIERLEEEKKTISDDIKDVYTEAKGSGYDVPALKAIVRARREDAAKREAREAMIDLYRVSIGMD